MPDQKGLLITDKRGYRHAVLYSDSTLEFFQNHNAINKPGERVKIEHMAMDEAEKLIKEQGVKDHNYSPEPKVGILQTQNTELLSENASLKERLAQLEALTASATPNPSKK